jgi:vacuolar protein sorting-associated protein 35
MDAAVSVELFVEILNRYVYYFDQENEAVSPPSLVILRIKVAK